MFLRSPFNDGGLISNTSLNYDAASTNISDYYINVGSAPAAIQYVGGRTNASNGSPNDINLSITALTGGIGTAPQYGDLIIVSLSIASTADRGYRIAGFTQIADLYQNDIEDSNFQVGYKLVGLVPDTGVTITGGGGNADDGLAVSIHVWRNVDQTTPLDVTSTTFGAIDSAVPNPPAITPVTSGAIIVVAAGAAHDATSGGAFTASYLSNFITSNTVAFGEVNDTTVGMGSVAWTSGAYDPAAWTFNGTGGTALNWSYNAVTMAIRPGPTVALGNLKNSGIWNLSGGIAPKTLNVQGNQTYTSGGSFVVPAGVTQISAVTIGGGGGGAGGNAGNDDGATGGAGGGLAYGTFAVTPGETLTISVGNGGNGGGAGSNGGAGGASSIARGATVLLQGGGGQGGQDRSTATRNGGVSTGTARIGGGDGGNSSGSLDTGGGGGGAGGYSAPGGAGGSSGAGGGSFGGGGGGGGGATTSGQGYGGGGVGIVGTGTSGTAGALNAVGTGGSGGTNGTRPNGGLYGGGGGACDDDTDGSGGAGGAGVVRLVWGKDYRFPSNAAANIVTASNQGGIAYIPTIS